MKNKTKNQIKNFLATLDANKILNTIRDTHLVKDATPQYIKIDWDFIASEVRLAVHRNIPTANIKKWLNTIDVKTILKDKLEYSAYELIQDKLFSKYEDQIYAIIDK